MLDDKPVWADLRSLRPRTPGEPRLQLGNLVARPQARRPRSVAAAWN